MLTALAVLVLVGGSALVALVAMLVGGMWRSRYHGRAGEAIVSTRRGGLAHGRP